MAPVHFLCISQAGLSTSRSSKSLTAWNLPESSPWQTASPRWGCMKRRGKLWNPYRHRTGCATGVASQIPAIHDIIPWDSTSIIPREKSGNYQPAPKALPRAMPLDPLTPYPSLLPEAIVPVPLAPPRLTRSAMLAVRELNRGARGSPGSCLGRPGRSRTGPRPGSRGRRRTSRRPGAPGPSPMPPP